MQGKPSATHTFHELELRPWWERFLFHSRSQPIHPTADYEQRPSIETRQMLKRSQLAHELPPLVNAPPTESLDV